VRRGTTPDAHQAPTTSLPRQEEESRGLEKVRRDYHFLFTVLACVGRVLSVWGSGELDRAPPPLPAADSLKDRPASGRRPWSSNGADRGAAPLNYSAEKGSTRQIGPNYLLTAKRTDRCTRAYWTIWSRARLNVNYLGFHSFSLQLLRCKLFGGFKVRLQGVAKMLSLDYSLLGSWKYEELLYLI